MQIVVPGIHLSPRLSAPGAYSQVLFLRVSSADNVDHNIDTIDGHGNSHGMGLMASVTPEK